MCGKSRQLIQYMAGNKHSYLPLLIKLEYQFPDRHITLWFWLVEEWSGEPWGKEGQPGRWIAQRALDSEAFPPANEPIITKLVQAAS